MSRRQVGHESAERRKPRGEHITVVVGPSGVDHQHFVWPATKAEIEKEVVRRALALVKDGAELPWPAEPQQNDDENHFDFTIPVADGPHYLDLMEFAPIQLMQRGHGDVPLEHRVGDYADRAAAMIRVKDQRYGVGKRRPPIHLLVYVTDYRLVLDGQTLELLRREFQSARVRFQTVSVVNPFVPMADSLTRIFPNAQPLFDLASRSNQLLRTTTIILPEYRPIDGEQGTGDEMKPSGITFNIDTRKYSGGRET